MKIWKSAVFLALIIVFLLASVGVAGAVTPQATSSPAKCFTQYFGGVKVAKGCVRATFTYDGGSLVSCSSPRWSKTIYDPAFSVTANIAPYCKPTGLTGGVSSVFGGLTFKRLGVTLNKKLCGVSCDNIGGKLICSGSCQDLW